MHEWNDEKVRDVLPEFVRGALDETTQAQVEAYISHHQAVQQEADMLRTYIAASNTIEASSAEVARIALAIPPYDPVTAGRVSVPRRWFSMSVPMQLAAVFVLAAVGITTVSLTRSHKEAPVTVSVPGVSVSSSQTASASKAHVSVATVSQAADPGVTLVGVNSLSDEDLAKLIDELNDVNAEPPREVESMMAVAWGGVI